jgi:hypothetical protein
MSKIEEAIRRALEFLEALDARDVAEASSALSADCAFKDIWQRDAPVVGKDAIRAYLDDLLARYPRSRIAVEDANNLVHKSIVRFRWFGLRENAETPVECIGVFDVRNDAITAIDMYGRIARDASEQRPRLDY